MFDRLKLRRAPPPPPDNTIRGMLDAAFRANTKAAGENTSAVSRDRTAITAFRAKLAGLGREIRTTDKIGALHFVYGLKQVEEFPFYAFMSIISAQAHHPTARTFFHLHHEPIGPFWEAIKDRVEIVQVPAFEWFDVAPVKHYAHKADVVRMLALHEVGGLYMDCDTITLRSMDELASHDFVMGVQQTIPGAMGGFCNAIMIAKAGSRFGENWLHEYRSFNSKGRDMHWDFHSVKLPMYLYSLDPTAATVLPHDKWFFPLWNHIYGFLFGTRHVEDNKALLEGQYAIHLWHNMVAEALDAWSPKRMQAEANLYALLCREAIAALEPGSRATVEQRLGIAGSVEASPAEPVQGA